MPGRSPGERAIAAAILILTEAVAEGLEKLDKPRFIYQYNPIDFTQYMDPGDLQNKGKE